MSADRLSSLRERLPAAADAAVSVTAGAAGVIASFAVAGQTPGFVVAPIAGFMARRLPGFVITFVIVVLGDLGEHLNLLSAIALAVGLLAALAGVGLAVGRRRGSSALGVGVVALGIGGVSYALTGAGLPSIGAAVAAAAVVGIAETAERLPAPGAAAVSADRRRVLAGLASALGVVVSGAAGRRATRTSPGPKRADDGTTGSVPDAGATPAAGPSAEGSTEPPEVDEGVTPTPAPGTVEALLAEAAEKSLDVRGLEPLVSGDDFYEVDINAIDPNLDASEWELSITGAVENERTITYDDLLAMEVEHHFITLRCVGEALNGKKMDNALWTGVPVASLMEGVEPRSGCECVMLRAADGYYEEFPMAALLTGLVAYRMDGAVLPRRHGYPARALIPGHWGEINVKWLTEIEVLEREADGYWERRGWHGTGPVNTVAKLHATNRFDDMIQVAGHAYAGTRGIESVEVSTDSGETWSEATLSAPLPGDDVWRQWEYTYPAPEDRHEVVVRATDGTGALQPRERARPFPNGPSGWVSAMIRP